MSSAPITLTLNADPSYARLVRMTASNAGLLSSMSMDRVEDIRMAAEEAFIYACTVQAGHPLTISFLVTDEGLTMRFQLGVDEFSEPDPENPTSLYADLILGSVCDSYQKLCCPAALVLELEADVR